jgi:hypothetical protein
LRGKRLFSPAIRRCFVLGRNYRTEGAAAKRKRIMKIKVIIALVLLFPAFSLPAEEDNQSREDEIKTLLYAVDRQATEYNDEITYVQRVNIGIPGGDNWLVEWHENKYNSYLLSCYAIQENMEIANDFFIGSNSYHFKASRFDIMAEIPGKRVRDSTTVIGDYNNDGVDELFMFIFGGSRTKIEISGYNPDIGSFFCMCSVDSAIVDPENGPAPVEFITYKGMEGFKVYCIAEQPHVAPPKNIIKGLYAWYFYAWDEKVREYVEVEEYIEGADYTKEDEIKTFLLATDKQSTIYNYELTMVEKVNWGLPEGDNWLVVWSRGIENYAKIYVIEGTEVKREMNALRTSRDPRDFSPFDIYKSLPGMTIRDGMGQIGDFNGDGLDEILVFGAGPSRPEVRIYGYERELNRIKGYCAIPHGLIDLENGPSPLEFVSYKGMRGFKVYYDLYWRPKESEPPRNIINEEYAWYFYIWDEEVRKYVEVEEYIEGADYAGVEVKEEEPATVPPPAVEPQITESDIPAIKTAEVTPAKPVLFAGIAAALLIAGVVIFALRKKK